MTNIDMTMLARSEPELHRLLVVDHNTPEAGDQDVDLMRLSQVNRGQLFDWIAGERKSAINPLPASGDRDIDADLKADLQRAADSHHAVQRLLEYSSQAGLEDTEANMLLIRNFVELSATKGYFSREIIDAAIACLGPRGTGQLTFRIVRVAPPQPEQPAVEVLGTLKDGTQQLRIEATEAEMKKASVMALQDLIKRRRAATNQQYIRRGSFGSNFI
jgi:hypothetical protein